MPVDFIVPTSFNILILVMNNVQFDEDGKGDDRTPFKTIPT